MGCGITTNKKQYENRKEFSHELKIKENLHPYFRCRNIIYLLQFDFPLVEPFAYELMLVVHIFNLVHLTRS